MNVTSGITKLRAIKGFRGLASLTVHTNSQYRYLNQPVMFFFFFLSQASHAKENIKDF